VISCVYRFASGDLKVASSALIWFSKLLRGKLHQTHGLAGELAKPVPAGKVIRDGR
jgi:hypothetical protein